MSFKKGEPVGQLLQGWRAARAQFTAEEWSEVCEVIEVVGQPKAWTDEIIASATLDFVTEQTPAKQSIILADCLSNQWTPSVMLKAWLKNCIYLPYAPDVTSFLQEPDTHEHHTLKSRDQEGQG